MATKDDGYFEIPEELLDILMDNGLVDEYFYMKDLKQRKLFINGGIYQESIIDIVRHIMQYNKEDEGISPDERQPIILYLTSQGGEVDAGFELIDVIQSSKTPVYTVNLGYWYSMGFIIGISGHKRFATRNAKFLIHDGNNFVYNSGAKAQDQMEFNKRVEARIRDFILENGKILPSEYDDNLRVEWYMFADEAKERGFIDYIVGIDCEIDEIV